MLALVGHEVDDRVVGEHVELGRVGVAGPDDLAGELDDRALEPEAQAEVRDAVLAGEVGGEDLALDAAVAEAARDEDAGDAVESVVEVLVGERLRIDPADLGVDLVRPGRVAERLGDRQVGVGQLDVLADEGDLEDRLGRLDPVDERPPRVEVRARLRVAEAELADDQPAEAGGLEHAAGPRRSCRRSRPG